MTDSKSKADSKATDAAVDKTADAPAVEVDPRDEEIARLQAEVDRLKNPSDVAPEDPKDRALWELRRQRAELLKTPEGELAELRKAHAALQAKVEEMATGKGLIPVPQGDGPDPYLYGCMLATGELIYAQHPHATHAHSPGFNIEVPVVSYFRLPDSQVDKAGKWADDYAAAAAAAAGR